MFSLVRDTFWLVRERPRLAAVRPPAARPKGALETVGDGGVELREEVPVAIEGDLGAAVADAGLWLRVGALGDGQG